MISSTGNCRKNEAFTRQPLHHHALMRLLIHFKGELVILLLVGKGKVEKKKKAQMNVSCLRIREPWIGCDLDRHISTTHITSHDVAHGFPNHREKISRAFVAQDGPQQRWIQLVYSPKVQKQISVCWLQWLWLHRHPQYIPVNNPIQESSNGLALIISSNEPLIVTWTFKQIYYVDFIETINVTVMFVLKSIQVSRNCQAFECTQWTSGRVEEEK